MTAGVRPDTRTKKCGQNSAITDERVSNSFKRRDSVEEILLAEAAFMDALVLFLTEVAFFGLGAALTWGSFGGENSNEFEEGCTLMGKSTVDDA